MVEVESESLIGGELSKGEAKVETTRMVLADEKLNPMESSSFYLSRFEFDTA